MKEFFKNFGYNFPESNWKEQVVVFFQLVLLGAMMSIPIIILMCIAGMMDQLSGL